MASHFYLRVNVGRSVRDRFTLEGGQEFEPGLLQLNAPLSFWEPRNPKEDFATHNGARHYPVSPVQAAKPFSIEDSDLIRSLIAFVSSR